MRAAWQGFIVLILALSLVSAAPGQASAAVPQAAAAALQSTLLTLTGPSGCSAEGCAYGQRLNLRFTYHLASYDPALTQDGNPNVKVCLYAPKAWGVQKTAVEMSALGLVSTRAYTSSPDCSQDLDTSPMYDLIAAQEVLLDYREYTDGLEYAFRINPSATSTSQFIARVFQRTTLPDQWVMTADTSTAPFKALQLASPVYVANDPASCGTAAPCYVNSGSDAPGGVGTGLKDAADAAPENTQVFVLGSYAIKSNTVVITRPLAVTGVGDAALTYSGGASGCGGAMLSLNLPSTTNPLTISRLNINDGSCASPNRNLIEVNSDGPVIIESNDLTGGDNAIYVNDRAGSVTVRFNNISGNGGRAVFWNGASGTPLEVVANNLHGNGSGSPVICSTGAGVIASRVANHNYWGGPPPSQNDSRCVTDTGKELGARVQLKTSAPGVNAELVTVTTAKNSAFDGQISYQRSGGNDFQLYLVDHGYAQDIAVPFAYRNISGPSPCSNYFDVFLARGASTGGGALDLFVKYNRTRACELAVHSTQFCDQSDAAKIPLFWYDPGGNVTDGWDTTGQKPAGTSAGGASGQATSCNITDRELKVSIDDSGRPNLSNDLGYLPLYAGIPVLKEFKPIVFAQRVDLTWTTNAEPDVKEFLVLRGTSENNMVYFGDPVAPKGNATTGAYYDSIKDTNRASNTTYYYRLQIVRTDGHSILSEVVTIAPNVPTATNTVVKTTTRTITPTPSITVRLPTRTPTRTLVRQNTATRIPSRTPTSRTPTPTRTAFLLETSTVTPVAGLTRTPDLFVTFSLTPAPGTQDAEETGYPVEITETPTPRPAATEIAMMASPTSSATPGRTLTPVVSGEGATGQNAWLSLLLGLLAGLATVGGAGYLFYRSRM